MSKVLRKIGRFFIELKPENQERLQQSILLVDGSFILPHNLALIIRNARNKFRNAHFSVLTFQDKEEFLRDNFPDIEIIIPAARLKNNRHRLGIQLLSLLFTKKFRFIILSSLDIPSTLASLLFANCPVFLHNRWIEWYRLRQRMLSDIFLGRKSADAKRNDIRKGIKGFIKSIGRFFIILTELDGKSITSNILIEDNGYTETGYIITAVRSAREIFINPDITILAFRSRREDIVNNFPDIKLITVREGGNKYKLAVEMFRARNRRFNYVILTTLDISPILASFLFMRAKVLLYNRWHEWWSLHFRNLFGYFTCFLVLLVKVPVFIYLFIVSGIILLRTNLRLSFKRS
ncbi:MAG: hypothetical protein PHQ57_01080 [Candidatus Omnitrophica bacterium]|nr:hypothetical protein [Candidatus Omnitrophota bacterium]